MNVSVVIACYNGAALIPAAIRSAQAQTMPPREIIVVDDGSTDASREVIAAFPGVRLVAQANAGVSAARNRGAEAAAGEWLLFLDQDDDLSPDALEIFGRTAAAHPGFPVYYGAIETERQGGRGWRTSGSAACEGPVPAALRANLFRVQILAPGAMLIRADLFRRVGGFDSRRDGVEDQDLFIRLGLQAEFKYCGAVVLRKRQHAANVSGNWQLTLMKGLACTLDHVERLRREGPAGALPAHAGGKAVDLALRRAFRYGDPAAVRQVLDFARARNVRTPWSCLWRRSDRWGQAYARLWKIAEQLWPGLRERWRYGRLG